MTADPLALGFIGGSLRSAVGYAHYCASVMDNEWHLAAGCFSRHEDDNEATAHAYGVPAERLHADWRAMIAAERHRLDAIVVLTPTPMHFEVVSACLAAGIPVICEKALAVSRAEAAGLARLRDRHRGFLAVTYNYSGYPMVRELRQLIRDGALGRLIHFHAEMPQEGFIRTDAQGHLPTPQAWRLHDGAVPTIYLDLGVHLHQMLHYLTGARPLRTVAEQGSHGWFHEIVDDVTCLVRCSDGLYGHVWFSKSALGHRNGLRIRLYGTKGSAEWYQLEPEEVLLNHGDGRREILDRAGAATVANQPRYTRFKAGHPAGFVEAFANLYRDIAISLRHYQATGECRSDEVFSAELAIEGLSLLEAIRDSAASGEWREVACGGADGDA